MTGGLRRVGRLLIQERPKRKHFSKGFPGRAMTQSGGATFVFCMLVAFAGCNFGENVEQYSVSVLADATTVAVPDTSRYNSIRVSLSGVLGYTNASSFEGVSYQRIDSLVQF